ncbi:MAG: DUF4388 domain-containing protein [Anaerolineae bacterium]|nr:DUF4388 domain-containing protein [Anaerolineae bacterium]
MALKGNLTDLNVADLIQLNCQSGVRAELIAQRETEHIALYFDAGQVVHAIAGEIQGAEAVYALLTWETGTFEMKQDVAPPAHTISLPWSALVMEGLRRLDEEREAKNVSLLGSRKEQVEMAGETRRDRLAKVLRDLLDSSGDVSGVAVVSMDGLIMASDLPATVDQARVGAVAAAILSLSGRSVGQLKRGALQQTLIQGGEGNIIILHAGPNAVFVALTGSSVNLGMVFLEVRECAAAVAEILG